MSKKKTTESEPVTVAGTIKKICEAALGIGIAVAATLAWRFWDFDAYFAIVLGSIGLGMACHAFGYDTNS